MRPLVKGLAAAAVLSVACGSAHAQQNVTLKMQATWPASLTLYENFIFFAERVSKLSNGTLKIDAMPAGQVVPAFEVLETADLDREDWQRFAATMTPNTDQMRALGHYAVDTRKRLRGHARS